ncbi:MAG: MFS transporter [Saprospiraceae bacterium]|nr:MFS transporter [Saprospiraceae bacterium]MCF8252623.1 MFS transporter [Saprospiraceae bacterium]MCF8283112.1 MFS transporter [Bacteroidales bacterium]MCF8314206.1 MFS transporter [Saprospiraceae bacterium]MCF8443006.1 MFS transporter [Saprospiraceae bacterium]
MTNDTKKAFTGYEVFIIFILAITQFTIVLDFMVLSPLGAILLKELDITTQQFGWVVSAYAFSAGSSGLLAAGFADRFDRKKLLMFFYTGFIIGTFLCGIAPSYHLLLAARIVTGIFGGVIGSVSFAIITDLFEFKVRGRVMGFVQMAFASSQVLGLPIGLYLASLWGWHAPFLMIVGLAVLILLAIMVKMRPVDGHLALKSERSAFGHLFKTVADSRYLQVFIATTLLSTGGYMLMPFGTAYAVGNLGLTIGQLPLIYLVTGICSMAAGPLIGKLADRVGAFKVFAAGSLLTIVMVLVYTNLGITPLWWVIVLNAVLFIGVTSRIISISALTTAVPDPADRGAFMGINSSVAQMSGGIAAAVAGMIVVKEDNGYLEHYPLLGMVVTAAMMVTIWQFYRVNRSLRERRRISEGEVEITK